MKKSATQKPNPTLQNPRNVYHIGGIPVEFPYKPYGSQLAFMARVISTLDRAQRDGHCHALLESPTGTGKSLSLLCSALAWQQHHGPRAQNQPDSNPDPKASSDPLNHGGGFVPESQLSESPTSEEAPPTTNGKSKKKKPVPTIYYASRTHSQISQVIREYRKTSYRVPMAILASRKHYCTNERVHGGDNLDEECKLLLENKENGCPQFKNVHRVKHHPSFHKGGCHEAHDIEDIVKVGKMVKGCSYYAARSMVDDAYIVFCPYSYVINPVVRRAMEVDIKGSILILDEAHNIEDMSRDAGSVDVDEDALQRLQMELGQLCGADTLTYQPLYEMVQDIMSWMERRKNSLEKRDFQHYFSGWTGDKALRELQDANISLQCFPILQECASKAIKAASDSESELAHLSGMSAMTLEGLFSSLSYFFHDNGAHIHDYQLVMQRLVKKDAVNSSGGWTQSFGLWCLNPAVVFRNIADLSLSVILTSGTLSPMNSFSSELGVPFNTLLEAPHVIDVESQVWASVISAGPRDYPLNASYKTADGYAFQDAVGRSLEEIFKVVPGGSLVFFPSYKLMDKLCKRWHETSQWSRLNARKTLFVEPRGGSQEDFESVLKGYYSFIQKGSKPAFGKRRKAKKVDTNGCTTTDSLGTCKDGAAFLAVFRGKVSEGIDFSDENARAVIIVGIPFPNINDVQVAEKKKYNDMYRHSKNLLSGSNWYCHQAFRALNQAAGRCIRHRFDYGAIIFLDERFREERNTTYISKWLRKSIRTYDNFETSVEELKAFFSDVKERVDNAKVLQDSVIDLENRFADNSGKVSVKRKNQKLGKPCVGEKRMSTSTAHSHCLSFQDDGVSGDMTVPLSNEEFLDSSPTRLSDRESGRENAHINGNFTKDFRCQHPLVGSLNERVELSVVKETPMNGGFVIASPEASMDNDNSHSTIIQSFAEFDQENNISFSVSVTPERESITKEFMPEIESSVNLSVNSHAQKRRASLDTLHINSIQEKFDVASREIMENYNEIGYSARNDSANQMTKVASKEHSSECKPKLRIPSAANDDSLLKFPSLSLNQQLQIFCSLCKNPLGCAETNRYVMCCSTLLSRVIFASVSDRKRRLDGETAPSIVRVLIVDTSSVDQQLCRKNKSVTGQGVWCQEDGCVYNTIFCPFCTSPNHCLGFQILAADASNFQFIDKILFDYDCLEVKNDIELKKKDTSKENGSCNGETVDIHRIEKYAFQSPQQRPGGWRMTKPKSNFLKRSPSLQYKE